MFRKGTLWLVAIACSAVCHADDRPNVVVILADDLGYSDLGCYGSEIETPTLDKLAANGLQFSQFYNTARCWPTRASILTGYYAQQVGRDALPNVPGGARSGRPRWAQLLPSMLQPLGYRAYHSGKWHVDGSPVKEGFDHSLTMDDHDRFFYPKRWTLDGEAQPAIEPGTEYYQTTAITSHAIDCLKEHASDYSDKPFFHFVAFTCPHFPLMAPAKDIAKYDGKYDAGWDEIRKQRWQRLQAKGLVKGNMSELEPEVGPPYSFPDAIEKLGEKEVNREVPWSSLTAEQKEFQADKMEIHAAMIDRMDQEIGRIVAQLEQMGELENTLVLFLSDNGSSAEIMIRGDGHDDSAARGSGDSYLCLGPGWSSVGNTPFRRHKTWVHEGGISTPLIAHWPKGIDAPGSIRNQVGHVVDIAPTILDLAGGEWPSEHDGEKVPENPGMSLVDVLRNSESEMEPRTIWWLHDGHKALRQGDFKLVAAKGEPLQLYNLTTDRAEESDLISGMPELAESMEKTWSEMTKSFEAMQKKQVKKKKQ